MSKNLFTSALFGAISLGSDPEIFLTDPSGKPWGARDCSTGTKEKPETLPDGALQVDGMALEFNINPAKTISEWVDNHAKVMDVLEQRAANEGLKICDASFLDFKDYIKEAKATEAELEFGCDPDLNAGTGLENKMPDNEDGSITFRTTGGHIHVGFSNWADACGDALQTARSLVKALDATIGLYSVIHDDGLERKKLYGNAGAFRVKPYGFEYRTLSNFWVFSTVHMEYMFTTVTKIMSMPFEDLKDLIDFAEAHYDEIEEAINNNNVSSAKMLYSHVKEQLLDA